MKCTYVELQGEGVFLVSEGEPGLAVVDGESVVRRQESVLVEG